MIAKRFYSHPRFMDVYFYVIVSRLFGWRYKVKVEWWRRGWSTRVMTNHEIERNKAKEFTWVDADGEPYAPTAADEKEG
jgi:hypothetical protein